MGFVIILVIIFMGRLWIIVLYAEAQDPQLPSEGPIEQDGGSQQ